MESTVVPVLAASMLAPPGSGLWLALALAHLPPAGLTSSLWLP